MTNWAEQNRLAKEEGNRRAARVSSKGARAILRRVARLRAKEAWAESLGQPSDMIDGFEIDALDREIGRRGLFLK